MRLFDGSILYWNDQQDDYSKAECYRKGRFVKQSMPRALALYQAATQHGDARAYFRLGQHEQNSDQWSRAFALYFQAGVRNNSEVMSWLENLVVENNAEAALILGKIFQHKKQYDKAVHAYTKAHELKHPDGMFHVGQLHSNLSSTQTQGVDVTNRYRDSARLGSKYGLNELIILSESNGKASQHLAQMYELGEGGLHKNNLRAVEFYETSSQQHCPESTYYLAELYAKGKSGIVVDIPKACRYYLLASQQGYSVALSSLTALASSGNMHAQYVLGYEHYRVKNDLERAAYWCVKAEIQGHKKSADYLQTTFSAELCWKIGGLYEKESASSEISLPKAIEFFKKSAQLHHAQAAFWLAHHYQSLSDKSVENKIAAFNYFLQSAQNGVEAALPALERFGNYGNVQQQKAISQLYGSLFYNSERSTYWNTKNQNAKARNTQLMK